jgi:hypothetical protein
MLVYQRVIWSNILQDLGHRLGCIIPLRILQALGRVEKAKAKMTKPLHASRCSEITPGPLGFLVQDVHGHNAGHLEVNATAIFFEDGVCYWV